MWLAAWIPRSSHHGRRAGTGQEDVPRHGLPPIRLGARAPLVHRSVHDSSPLVSIPSSLSTSAVRDAATVKAQLTLWLTVPEAVGRLRLWLRGWQAHMTYGPRLVREHRTAGRLPGRLALSL